MPEIRQLHHIAADERRPAAARTLQAPAKEHIVKDLLARHIRDGESDRRGIKDGWYAMSAAGAVCSGPFSTHAACEAHIEQERGDINAYHQGAANQH